MNKNDKALVKEFLPEYLKMKGFPIKKAFRCINPEHEDRHPSMSYDSKRNKVHCFACGVTYDLFDCISILEGLVDMKDVFAFANNVFLNKEKRNSGKEKKSFNVSDLTMTKEGYDYLNSRGISNEVCDRFNLVYSPDFFYGFRPFDAHWKAVIIPTSDSTFTVRNIDATEKSQRIRKVGGSPLYNSSVLYNKSKDTPVFVTEGEIDALSFYEANADAMALGSTANTKAFLDLVRQKKPLRTLILSLDNDEMGKKSQKVIADELLKADVPFVEINVAGAYKDVNEALVNDRNSFLAKISEIVSSEEYATVSARSAYSKKSALSLLRDLKTSTFVSTGFSSLDKILNGGFFNELHILGGVSGVGKTSFALQLADQIAEQGRDVLFFSMEMSSRILVAKSISRLMYKQNKTTAMTARELTSAAYAPTSDRTKSYTAAVKRYEKFGSHMFIVESLSTAVSDVISSIREHIRLTDNVPVVFIDYLQLLDADKKTDKQNVDICVRNLRRACRELSLPIFALSSFGRSGYKEEAAFESFKESGGIEYSSDVLLALQFKGVSSPRFDINSAKNKPVRELELSVLKNRMGASGEKIQLAYTPKYDTFIEL